MSYDDFEIGYCLTDSGWLLVESEPNAIIIEKWLEKTHQGSGFGKESKHGHLIWTNPEFSQEQRKAFHARFPSPWSEEEQWKRRQEFSRNLPSLLKDKKRISN